MSPNQKDPFRTSRTKLTSRAPQGKPSTFGQGDTAFAYKPQPRQRAFHSCGAEVILYGGAAGGGKSMAILAELYTRAREIPGSYNIAFRRTFPELEKSLILKSRQMFPRGYCRFNEMTKVWTIRPKDGGQDSFIAFGYCRNAKEAEEIYKSAEFTTLAIDEATLFDWDTVRFLMTRARSSIPGAKVRRIFATNPGGIGHMWAKEYFGIWTPDEKGYVEPETVFTPAPTDDDPMPLSRCFIPAKLSDNPALMENDPTYLKTLMMLREDKRKMLLDGSWDVFEGKFFPEFTSANLIMPFDIPRHWKIYRAIDYGYSAPFCCLWFAIAPDGHIYLFREAYLKNLTAPNQAILVRDMSKEPVEYTIGDPSMHSKKDGKSFAEDYLTAANIAVYPASNDRAAGWGQCRNMLGRHSDGKPILLVFNGICPMFTKEIQMAVYGDQESNPDDINIRSRHDHAIDAWRYFAVSRPLIPREPEQDPYAHLDEASRREWARNDERARLLQAGDPRATLHSLNREDDDDDGLHF